MDVMPLKNDHRKMIRVSAHQEGIEVTFEDGTSGTVPYTEIPEIKDVSMMTSLELSGPFEIKVLLKNREEVELPWDFVRHYCDNEYKPRIEEIALQGRKALGNVIRQVREKQNITQEELAKLADISRATAVRIEKGEHSPRYSTLQSIAGALKTTVTDLLSGNLGGKIETNHDYRSMAQAVSEKEEGYQERTRNSYERSAQSKLEEALTRVNNGEWETALDCVKEAESLLSRILKKSGTGSKSHYTAKSL